MPPPIHFSHVGLHAFDHEALAAFYKARLGLIETDRGELEGRGHLIFLSRNPAEHHQLVLISGRTAPPGAVLVNQVSFRVDSLEDLQTLWRELREAPEVTEIRPIDHGIAWALYLHDPEGNRIELFVDSPWYVSQPKSDPFDIDRPPAAIRADTEAKVRSLPGFRPAEAFRAEVAARIEAGLSR